MLYYLIAVYNFTQNVRDRILVKIPVTYNALLICHGMKMEQAPFFYYKSHVLRKQSSDLLVVVYAEHLIGVCAEVLIVTYDQYRLS